MHEIILINISGRDRAGITATLSEVLGRYNVEVLDFGQAVIHDFLTWGMLVVVPSEATSSSVFKELLFEAHRLELDIRFTPVSDDRYEQWVEDKDEARHTITLLGRTVTARHIAEVSRILASHDFNIVRITRISGRRSLATPMNRRRAAIELAVRGDTPDIATVRTQLLNLANESELDIAIQADDVYRRYRRLVCFDMDSTLIQGEVIDDLGKIAGVEAQIAEITARAMHGDMSFAESLSERLTLLKGLDESALESVAQSLTLTEGAERLISTLKELGFKIAILSGGFTYFANRLREALDIDYAYAHELDIVDGKLTGRIKGDVIDGDKKAELLRSIANREGIKLEQVIAVGDGANDISMLSIAGLGIAFHAKPAVHRHAQHAISTLGLDGILYLLGMRDRELPDWETRR